MHILTNLTAEAVAETAVSEENIRSIWNSISGLSLMSMLRIIVLIIVLILLIRIVSRLFDRILDQSNIDQTAHGFLRATVRAVCWFIAAMIVAGSLNIDVTSLIAVLSVVGLALSLAIQGALSNLAGGIVILVTRPFRVGDYVMIGSDEGFVQEINMTYTRLNTSAHRVISIPNSTVTSSNVINYSTAGRRMVDVRICVDYASNLDAAKQAFQKAVLAVPELKDTDGIFTRVSGFRDCGIEFTIRAWCRNEDYWEAHYNLMESVKRTMDEEGISMTYTNYNVHIVQ